MRNNGLLIGGIVLLAFGIAGFCLLMYVSHKEDEHQQTDRKVLYQAANNTIGALAQSALNAENAAHLREWESTMRTPVLYLYMPSSGAFAGYWEQPLNKNFDLIDDAYRTQRDRLRAIETRMSVIDGKSMTIVALNPLPPLSQSPTAEEMNAKFKLVDDCYRQEIEIEKELDRRMADLEKGKRRKQ